MEDEKIGLIAAAEDILSAVRADDPEALAACLADFFMMADSMPHEEGEHLASGGPVDPLYDQRRQARKFGEY